MLQTRELIEMIRKVRFNKIDSGLQMLQGPMTVKLNNLSAMEINTIRPFFARALNQFWKLSKVGIFLILIQPFKSPAVFAMNKHINLVIFILPQLQMAEPEEVSLQPSARFTQGSAESPVRQLRGAVAA